MQLCLNAEAKEFAIIQKSIYIFMLMKIPRSWAQYCPSELLVASCYGQSHYVLFALAQNLRVMPKYKWVYNQRLMKRRPTVANQPSAASQPPFFSLSSPLHRDYKSNAQ